MRNASSKDIIRGTADDVGEVGGIEGRDDEIKHPGLHGFHVKSCVHNPRYNDHIDRTRRPLGNRQNISPSSVPEFCIGKHEGAGFNPPSIGLACACDSAWVTRKPWHSRAYFSERRVSGFSWMSSAVIFSVLGSPSRACGSSVGQKSGTVSS